VDVSAGRQPMEQIFVKIHTKTAAFIRLDMTKIYIDPTSWAPPTMKV
jgi:hypothetical protein